MRTTNNDIIQYVFDEAFGNDNINVGDYGGFGFSSSDTHTHRHNDYYEITCVISGVFIHTYKEHNYNLTPGSLLLMTPNSVHQLYTEPMQATFFALCIREDYFQTFLKQHFPDHAENALSKCTALQLDSADFTYFEQLGRQMSAARPPLHVADMITYLTLINVFYKKSQPQKNKFEPVHRILNMLNEPSNLHLSAKRLYESVDISATNLINSFKEQTGYTIVEYKNKKRMEFAANMLRNTDKKIIDIAYELHYDSLSYFLRSFKKEFGVTPTEYRKKYKNNPIS